MGAIGYILLVSSYFFTDYTFYVIQFWASLFLLAYSVKLRNNIFIAVNGTILTILIWRVL